MHVCVRARASFLRTDTRVSVSMAPDQEGLHTTDGILITGESLSAVTCEWSSSELQLVTG